MRKTASELLSVYNGYEIQAWIAGASVEELEDLIRVAAEREAPSCVIDEARTALQVQLSKAALKPHWSVTPGFWIGLIGTFVGVAGVVIAWLSLRHDIQESKSVSQWKKPATENNIPPSTSVTNLPAAKSPTK